MINLTKLAAIGGALLATACTSLPLMASPARPDCAAKSYTIYYS